jgi:hypothetical protein
MTIGNKRLAAMRAGRVRETTPEMSEAQVNEHNRRSAWQDVITHLHASLHSLEHAQGSFEDLGVYDDTVSTYADQLQPLVDAIRRATLDAEEQAGRQ